MHSKISILGGGAWGEALAAAFSSKCEQIIIYKRNLDSNFSKGNRPLSKLVCEEEFRENLANRTGTCSNAHEDLSTKLTNKLPSNVEFPKRSNIEYTSQISKAFTNKIIFLAVPAQSVRDILMQVKFVLNDHYLVICSKGVEISTSKFMSQIASEFISSDRVAILSGPNFADEIIKGMPAASVIASSNFQFARELAASLSHDRFYLYPTEDVVSTEIGGALKNIIAIACGIVIGLNMGENYKASLISAGLAEMNKLSSIFGGKSNTLMGLAGIGDLTLTCNSQKSRNFKFGFESVTNKVISKDITIEGAHSSKSIKFLADKYNINLPICHFVYEYLYNDCQAEKILDLLKQIEFVK